MLNFGPTIFSFCLYGTERNYYQGLLDNMQIIGTTFENYRIFIYKGICDPSWEIIDDPLVTVIDTGREGAINMLFRYLPVLTHTRGFIRDADSRISDRDIWCMEEFIKSNKKFHTIRDHYWHKSKISGGLFGWKSHVSFNLDIGNTNAGYGYDEKYINEHLYPIIKSELLVHSSVYGYIGETVCTIDHNRIDKYDFVGNVIWDNKPKFEYTIGRYYELFEILRTNDQFMLIKHISDHLDIEQITWNERSTIFDTAYIANYYLSDFEKCKYWLSQFEFAEISPHVKSNAKYLFGKLGKKVATFDPYRDTKEGEIVIVYGNYPDWHLSLPCSNKIYRNAVLFTELDHDIVEYHPSWEKIDVIYILNMETRPDRMNDIMCSLSKVRAPLHRIRFIAGKKGKNPYVECTEDHSKAIYDFKNSGFSKCLILEDDVVFTDNIIFFWDSLQKFCEKDYDFDICFLAISKHGERQKYDDLLSRSKQACTTSSAYILCSETVGKVFDVVNEGLMIMKTTGETHNTCIDRYWSKLEKMFFFKEKLAFQRPAISMTAGQINYNLD